MYLISSHIRLIKDIKTGNCVEPYRLALKHAAFESLIMEKEKEKLAKKTDANVKQPKSFERGSSITREPPPNPGVANIRGIVVGMEPQSSRGAAYLRNTGRLVKIHSKEEKRDYSKEEKFKLKRRCSSIIIEDEQDIKNLEVRICI